MSLGEEAPRRLGCPCQEPQLWKPSLEASPRPSSLLREGWLAWLQPPLFSTISKYFTQTRFVLSLY